jgi:hypothetical protein
MYATTSSARVHSLLCIEVVVCLMNENLVASTSKFDENAKSDEQDLSLDPFHGKKYTH